jgi:hypothetical protein
MKPVEVVVQGTVMEDGRLVLDENPNLPPGRVCAILRPVPSPAPPDETLTDTLRRIWAAQEARGYKGRPWSEIMADLDTLRDEWDEGRPLAVPRSNECDEAPPALDMPGGDK